MDSSSLSQSQGEVGEVLEQHSRFGELMLSKDLEGILKLVDDAVVDMAPGIPTSVGKPAFEERLQMIMEKYDTELESEVKQAEASGDFAFVRAEFEGAWIPKDGSQPLRLKGKWLQIWNQQPDGGWKLLQNIWNRDD